jgi:hypothetical protein
MRVAPWLHHDRLGCISALAASWQVPAREQEKADPYIQNLMRVRFGPSLCLTGSALKCNQGHGWS